MNEVQILRREIAAQRRRLRDIVGRVARGSSSTKINVVLSELYVRYLMYFIGLEQRRLRAHLECLAAKPPPPGADQAALRQADEALQALDVLTASPDYRGAPSTHPEPARMAELLTGRVLPAADALDAIAERCYGIEDWRRAAHVDADSILEERRLCQGVMRHAGSDAGN